MSEQDCYRGIIHFHSSSSFDSVTRINTIISVARRERLDFIILTDHNTIRGSQALAKRVRELDLDIIAPFAAEYRTSHGDVIAVFLEREIAARDFDGFKAEAREQQAVLLLPHPYSSHTDVDYLAQNVDLIETYNGRIKPERNERAKLLAERYSKPGYSASDAHLASNIANVIVSVERKGDLRESLLKGTIHAEKQIPVPRNDVVLSQAVKMIKTRDLRLLRTGLLQLLGKLARR